MTVSLEGQTVLVTGGSRGIGAAMVRALGAAGATVAVHCRSGAEAAAQLAAEAGPDSAVFQADLADPQACAALARAVLDRYGRIDGLVSNAGIALPAADADPLPDWLGAWHTTLNVNLIAPALLCRELIPQMIRQGGGRIVHVASRAAFRGDTPDYMAYAASKGGMVALHRSIARGYGRQGIKSFLLAPGFTRTGMAQQFIDTYGEALAMQDLALDRLTEPEDLAPAAVFFLSGLLDHATGATLDLNAGSYVH
jgi:NAD(P)-dependent dehydrogenase (short-subunit alcohol dehydrogenase family)